MKREDLPRLFNPIYHRAKNIYSALYRCSIDDCCGCRLSTDKKCYDTIKDEIEELYSQIGALKNVTKKMD